MKTPNRPDIIFIYLKLIVRSKIFLNFGKLTQARVYNDSNPFFPKFRYSKFEKIWTSDRCFPIKGFMLLSSLGDPYLRKFFSLPILLFCAYGLPNFQYSKYHSLNSLFKYSNILLRLNFLPASPVNFLVTFLLILIRVLISFGLSLISLYMFIIKLKI